MSFRIYDAKAGGGWPFFVGPKASVCICVSGYLVFTANIIIFAPLFKNRVMGN